MFEFIIKALYEYISQQVPEVTYIDIYKGGGIAAIHSGEIEGASRPAILLELGDLNVDDILGNKNQRFTGSVTMHIVTDAYGGFAYRSDNLDLNFSSVNIIDNIYKKLNGITKFSINDSEYIMGSFSRTGLSFPEELGNLMDTRVTFEFVIIDNSLNLTQQPVILNNINIEIN